MPISTSLKQHVYLIREAVIRTVQEMPEDKLHFTPGPNCRPFVDIALHIAKARWNLGNLLTGSKEPFVADNVTTRAALVEVLRQGQERSRALLDTISEAALAERHSMPIGERSGLDIVHLLLMHEADHHGNLVLLAKLCGATPPDLPAVFKSLQVKTD